MVRLVRGSDLEAKLIAWIWPGWLAAGKLHVLGGQPGTGKTTLAILIAAIVTQAGRWPDGTFALAGNVVIWSGEDDPADTLLPRLIASGADRARVFFVTGVQDRGEHRAFDPAKDMLMLREAIAAIKNVRLIIVDPIVSAVQGDSHKNAETRRGLAPLVELASHIGAALIGITHFSKGTSGREPIERITGSLAFGALARIVLIAAKEPDSKDGTEGRRIFARAKSNIGPDEGGFAYRLEQVLMPGDDQITASIAKFLEPIEGTARDMLAVADAPADETAHSSALADAQAFLVDLLLDGPMPAKEVKVAARDAAQSWRTVERAKDRLGIISRRDGETGKWVWVINSQGRQDRQTPERKDRQTPASQTVENIEDRQHRQEKRVGDLGPTPPAQNVGGLGGLGGLAPEEESIEL